MTGQPADIPAKARTSLERVRLAAEALALPVEIVTMDRSTRTAEDAAAACDCGVAQIVKSLVFENTGNGALVLLLVSGAHNADLAFISSQYGLTLERSDGRRVRDETGFAIGGVAPIGHLAPIDTYMDESLLQFSEVWAAAGRPDAVFRVKPDALAQAIKPHVVKVTA